MNAILRPLRNVSARLEVVVFREGWFNEPVEHAVVGSPMNFAYAKSVSFGSREKRRDVPNDVFLGRTSNTGRRAACSPTSGIA